MNNDTEQEPLNAEENNSEFASDRPIEHLEQDLFGREKFARHLAASIKRREGRESFVVCLQGAWGCGKSSIKNMVLEVLEEDNAGPEIVEFDPWQLKDSNALFAAFFGEIALKIGHEEQNDGRQKLRSYSKNLALLGNTVKWVGIAGETFGLAGASIVGNTAAKGAKDISDVLDLGVDAMGEFKTSLKQQKKDLREALKKLEKPLLVVIDDIDRLEVEEMMLVFQLVKANADFPNFTYLLLMQRDRVEEALVTRLGEYGRDYLDKIVQLPIDVPTIHATQRQVLMKDGIEKILKSWQLSFSAEYKSDIDLLWEKGGLGELLSQPRDIIRLLNALEFSLAIMVGEAGLEVDLADFVALEALRITEPKVYAQLPNVKEYLVNPRRSTNKEHGQYAHVLGNSNLDEDEVPGNAEIVAVLLKLSGHRSHAGRKVLTWVFPQAYWAFKTSKEAKSYAIHNRRNALWKASSYFALRVPQNQISQAQIQKFYYSFGQPEAMWEQLDDFRKQELLTVFLGEILQRIDKVPEEHNISLLTTILNFSDAHGRELDLYLWVSVFIEEVLKTMPDVETRGLVLIEALTNSLAYGIPAAFVAELQKEDQKNESINAKNEVWALQKACATTEQLSQLRWLLVERIAAHAIDGTLWNSPLYLHSINFWAETQPETLKDWVNAQIEKDDQLHTFLIHFRSISTIVNDPPVFNDVEIILGVFDWLENLDEVKTRIAALDTSNWDVLDKLTASKFEKQADYILRQRQSSASITST